MLLLIKYRSLFSIMAIAMMLVACINEPVSVAPFGKGARLPRLSLLSNNRFILSWVEPVNQGYALKFSIYSDNQWSQQYEVARGKNWFINWADFPSVVAINQTFWLSHRLVKQTGGKSYGYDIVLAISNDAGQTWRDIGSPHRDQEKSEHGFATIFSHDNKAGVIWLDGREYLKKEERGKNSTKSGNFNLRYTQVTVDGSLTPEQVIDDNTCTCCSTSVAVSSFGPIAAWRGRTENEIRDNFTARLEYKHWLAPQPLGGEAWQIDGCPVNGPVIIAKANHVVAAWFTAANDQPRVRAALSKDGGKSFSAPIDIDNASPLGRIGMTWKDDQTAVISWMAAQAATSQQSRLLLRTISMNGSVGPLKTVETISASRTTGFPQVIVNQQKLVLVWTKPAPQYGLAIKQVPWTDLSIYEAPTASILSKFSIMADICRHVTKGE